uniref:Uncharacterized protein n=1 Tax=Arundo donax TaxID=35708 RepID=A0A0A9CD70_ARUDO
MMTKLKHCIYLVWWVLLTAEAFSLIVWTVKRAIQTNDGWQSSFPYAITIFLCLNVVATLLFLSHRSTTAKRSYKQA